MVGLLNAPRDTKLFERLKKENRIIEDSTGDNTDCSLNFIPKMDPKALIEGYRSVVETIYKPKNYYKTVRTLLKNYQPPKEKPPIRLKEIKIMLRSMWQIGIVGKGRTHYWRLMIWSIFKCPKNFNLAIVHAIYGFHFRKVFTK
jgi:hypothetical protein